MDPGQLAREYAERHDIDLSKTSGSSIDLTSETITESVHLQNSNCQDDRLKFVFGKLIDHLHDFVRETSLTTEEWMSALQFLTETGQKCTSTRQEFILLSDTLGVSALVDAINNSKPPNATEDSVLGPFLTADAKLLDHGESISSEGKGHYMYVEGKVTSTQGVPIPGAIIDTWETDGFGQYDIQYENREEPDCRGRLVSQEDGSYAFKAVVPVPYTIPHDGPVGKMIEKLNRHTYRPSHLHIRIEAPGYETLTTALYFEGDPFVTSDVVFGVKSSLIVKTTVVGDSDIAKARGFADPAKPHVYLKQDFVLATPEECEVVRQRQ